MMNKNLCPNCSEPMKSIPAEVTSRSQKGKKCIHCGALFSGAVFGGAYLYLGPSKGIDDMGRNFIGARLRCILIPPIKGGADD